MFRLLSALFPRRKAKPPPPLLTRLNRLFNPLAKLPLSAASLRRPPSGLQSTPGLDRAHTLSLELAVKLWREAFGDAGVRHQELKDLRRFAAQRHNVRLTCQHTNRVLHVKYDRDIWYAVANGERVKDPGARKRLAEVIVILSEGVKAEKGKTKTFCAKSMAILKRCQ